MRTRHFILGTSLLLIAQLQASYLDDIGLTTLRARDASLDGSGVTVAQVEASTGGGAWQTDPSNMGLDSSLFNYFTTDTDDTDGSNSEYPDGMDFSSSLESSHANTVGGNFFGNSSGVAPGVSAIQVFSASYFYYDGKTDENENDVSTSIIANLTNIEAKVVNQSFVYTDEANTPTEYLAVDANYDIYASLYDTLFVNGVGNTTGSPPSPATMYNGIAVGLISGSSSIGPTTEGRSKPDIVAPSNLTSYATPYVAGAATLLVQAGNNDAGGTGTASDATDIRTLKALLLNGAVKTSDWEQIDDEPLDRNHGAGVVNINNAHLQLTAGQYTETVSDTASDSGDTHLPSSSITTTVGSNMGWNLSTLTNASSGLGPFQTYSDATDDYYFECDAADASSFKLTATLVWNRNAVSRPNSYIFYDLNNLDLFLYKEGTSGYELVASSVSTVDNVEHLYQLDLEPGRYVLQVYKPGDGSATANETYALAFNFEAGAPLAASDASATPLSSSAIQLNWSDNAERETGYRIERRIAGGSYSSLNTLDADTETYTDSSCAAGTTYEYQIIAYNDNGDAAPAEASATTHSEQEAWRLSYFGSTSNSGDGADDADPDLDGLSNLIEFATGSDPQSSSPNPISTDLLASDQQFSFTWRSNSGYDYSIGYSEDLNNGFTYYSSSALESELISELELIDTETIDSEFETLTYGITDSVSSNQVFIRLQIE
ncbi:S8 family serine peptidase [Coraliomargarita sp. SDUM461004]|uniref:S8 family serine peptidase n=1 Tax=Thalassobacterium sedimentorum TaxID=3041258 RepID=A0ABU1AIN0_9BACT|nr:S8 family serine peptidase [Coraliomargarita sp. SDUM461004]MDQ8193735.1 S8 family serine peptidase [Coraliomargarita sp. SDUM461004]